MSLAQFANGLFRSQRVDVFDVGPHPIFLPEGTPVRRELCLLLVDLVIGWKLRLKPPTDCEALLSIDG